MKRIIGYDIARALAVVGMVLVNFKIAMGAEQNGPVWLQQLLGLLDGRAAATFVVLAGAGLSLLSQKGREAKDPRRLARDRNTLLKRALFLLVVGLMYTPIWSADILHFYGVYIAVAAFVLAAPTRRLWAMAGGLVVGFVVLFIALDYETGWDFSTLEYSGFWTADGMVRHLFYNGFHPVVPWLAFMLLGMVIGRQDMTDAAVRRRVIVWGVSVALVAEAVSIGLVRGLSVGASPTDLEDITAVFGTAPMPPLPLYMLAGAGTACAVIGLAIALGERFPEARWLHPLVATGQLALTLYVAHVIVGMGTLEAMGRLENQSLGFSLGAACLFSAVSVVFAHLWRMRFKRGPLEAVMRAVTDPR